MTLNSLHGSLYGTVFHYSKVFRLGMSVDWVSE